MTRIMKERWDANKDKLRDALAERTDLNHCNYEDLVNLAFEVIYNTDTNETGYQVLNLNNITVVDMVRRRRLSRNRGVSHSVRYLSAQRA